MFPYEFTLEFEEEFCDSKSLVKDSVSIAPKVEAMKVYVKAVAIDENGIEQSFLLETEAWVQKRSDKCIHISTEFGVCNNFIPIKEFVVRESKE